MVDYSKWDKLADDMSDEDEDDFRGAKPSVTRLDGPSSVTFGQGKVSSSSSSSHQPSSSSSHSAKSNTQYSKWDKVANEISDEDEDEDEEYFDDEEAKEHASSKYQPVPSHSVPSHSALSHSVPSHSAHSSSTIHRPSSPKGVDRAHNGGTTDLFDWKQDAKEVVLSCFVPSKTKASEISVKLQERSIEILLNKKPLVVGKLAFPAHVDDDDYVDWSLKDIPGDSSRRIVRLTLIKKNIEGVVVWWNRVLENDHPIDTSTIAERKTKNQSEYQKVWDEAHRLFKEKVENHKPIEVPLMDDETEEEDINNEES